MGEAQRENALGQNRRGVSQKYRPTKRQTGDILTYRVRSLFHPFRREYHRRAHRSGNRRKSVYAVFSGVKRVQSGAAV